MFSQEKHEENSKWMVLGTYSTVLCDQLSSLLKKLRIKELNFMYYNENAGSSIEGIINLFLK